MSSPQIPQADWARYLNTMGAQLGSRPMVPLDEEGLLAAATQQTGLADFGDPGFREPLRIVLRALETEAELTLTGRLLAAADVLRLLESRLRIIDTEKKHPEIANETISSPIFVLGMGRTGTTILHELLQQDPGNRAPLLWEMMSPAPPSPPGADHREKLALADAFMHVWDEIDPSYKTKHEGGGALTNECTFMMLHEFYGDPFIGCHDVPSYAMWMAQADPTPAYRMHKRILQMLQWRHAPKRKAPAHLSVLPILLSIYPDAKIAHTHRDPVKVVHSVTSLIASLRLMRSEKFDAESITEGMNVGQVMGLEKVIHERERGVVPATQIADVFFTEFMRNPVGEVEKLYAHWGLALSDEARQAMQIYMEARPRTKHGKHEYAYAEAVDIDKERRRYKRYMEHYGIEPE